MNKLTLFFSTNINFMLNNALNNIAENGNQYNIANTFRAYFN